MRKQSQSFNPNTDYEGRNLRTRYASIWTLPSPRKKLSEVIQACYHGRVRVLFFDERVVIQGRFDPALQLPVANVEGLKIEFSPYNTDLVEAAVEQTIRHRGEVYFVSSSEMPGQGPLAALFRY